MIWKEVDIAQTDLLDPEECGWKKDANGALSILWFFDLVHLQLADILSENQTTLKQEIDTDDDMQSNVDSDAERQDHLDS